MTFPVKTFISSILIIFLFLQCQSDVPEKDPAYRAEIQEWQQKRLASLKKETGWLSLIGLHRLEPGENTIGSASDNAIVIEYDRVPARLGTFILEETGTAAFTSHSDVAVFHDSIQVDNVIAFSDSISPAVLSHKSISWFVIKRGDTYFVRMRDAENPAISALEKIDSYPISESWRIKARLEPYDPPKSIPIDNVVGITSAVPCPGALVFEIDGESYRLDTIDADDQLWLIFADATSGYETYGAGRYLYVDKPDSSGITYIDFNKSYNPPCAFTEFATCPLPPLQNRLSAKITAGEKSTGLYF